MQYAPGVSGGKPAAQLARNVGDLFRRKTADTPYQCRKVFALHQLHGEEEGAVGVAHVEHTTDRRMRNLPCDANFVDDSCGFVPGGGDRDQLQGTGVCRMTSSARQTSPIPPRPIRATIR